MTASTKTILLCAAGYFFSSLIGGFLSGAARTHTGTVGWRLVVWLVCAIIFAAHIFVERNKRETKPVRAARLAALAVAIGAFAVALAALVRSAMLNGEIAPRLALALLIFPIAAGLPALVVAFIAAQMIGRRQKL